MVSLLDGEIRTLIPWTLCDIMEPTDDERDRLDCPGLMYMHLNR